MRLTKPSIRANARKLILILLFVTILPNFLLFSSISSSPCPSQFNLNPAVSPNGIQLISYNTYIKVASTLFSQTYTIFNNRVSFTSSSFGSCNSSPYSFTIGSQNTNIILQSMTPSSLSISTSSSSSNPFVYYYNTSDANVLFGNPQVELSFVPISSITSCGTPCAAYNSTGGFIQVAGLLSSSQILFSNISPSTVQQCTGFQKTSSSTLSGFLLLPILVIIVVAGIIIASFFIFSSGSGGFSLEFEGDILGTIALPIIVIGIVIAIGIGLTVLLTFNNVGTSVLGC